MKVSPPKTIYCSELNTVVANSKNQHTEMNILKKKVYFGKVFLRPKFCSFQRIEYEEMAISILKQPLHA